MNNIHSETIKFIYKFNFKEQITVSFEIKINYQTLLIENNVTHSDKEWTKLKNFKCPNCPLDEKENEFCPLAINLVYTNHLFNYYMSPL